MNILQRMAVKTAQVVFGSEVIKYREPESETYGRRLMTLMRSNDPLAEMIRKMMSGSSDLTAVNDWAPTFYGENYATSVPVYRAVKLRADAVARAPIKAFTKRIDDELEFVGEDHPVQQLLDKVNPWWSQADLLRGIETYLNLWGSAFRYVNRRAPGVDPLDPSTWEMWLLRPDKMAVVKDPEKYIRGFIFDPAGARFAMLPDEVLWDRYFNPLDEFAGLSPIAPGRASIEMQKDMLRVNRQLFKNGVLAQNLAFLMNGPLEETDVEEFYARLEKRFHGGNQFQRPIVMSKGDGEVKNLGFSNREMEFFQGLTFSLQEVARMFSVPPTLMFDMTQSIYNNVSEARSDFYENTITQEWNLIQSGMQERFIPMLPDLYSNLILKFDTANIEALMESEAAKAVRDQGDVAAGIKTINEVRRDRGLPEVPWGDDWWIAFGLVPASSMINSGSLPIPVEEAMLGRRREGDLTVYAEEVMRRYGHSRIVVPGQGMKGKPLPHQLFAKREQKQLMEYTAAMDDLAWRSYVRRLEEHEASFIEMQKQLFQEQKIEVLELVKKNFVRISRFIDPGKVFQSVQWIQRFVLFGRPLMLGALGDSAQTQALEFDLRIDFDLELTLPQAWADERAKFWATRVNEETARLLLEELEEANSEGESIAQIQRRIEDVFDISDEVRSEAIARTEMTVATNEGHLQVYQQAGVRRKRWLAELDGRVRPAHRAAHGQVVDLEDPFTVGGEALPAPGQGGSPANVINCRCTITPVLD